MAQTTLPPRQPAVDRGGPTLVPGGRRQRRWSLALIAVLLTAGSALAFVVLWLNAGDRTPVIVVARPVEAGQTFTAEDLEVVRISADPGITPLAASLRDDVIGQTAAVELLPGMLLVSDAVGSPDSTDDSSAVVALPLAESDVPDLERGDHVTVFRSAGNSTEEVPAVAIGEARVMGVDDAEGGQVSVSISVDEDALPEIIAAKARDQITLSKT
jgi:hypothetical protein